MIRVLDSPYKGDFIFQNNGENRTSSLRNPVFSKSFLAFNAESKTLTGLEDPKRYVPGTKMQLHGGIPKIRDRADIIEYRNTQIDPFSVISCNSAVTLTFFG